MSFTFGVLIGFVYGRWPKTAIGLILALFVLSFIVDVQVAVAGEPVKAGPSLDWGFLWAFVGFFMGESLASRFDR